MTVDKVIETIKAVKCGYDAGDEQLVHYIETAENMILSDIVSGREGDAEMMEQYGGAIDLDNYRERELCAPKPFEDIYVQYAVSQLDLLAEEGERYLNDMAVFRDTFTDLKRWWWQTHRQKSNYNYHF